MDGNRLFTDGGSLPEMMMVVLKLGKNAKPCLMKQNTIPVLWNHGMDSFYSVY
jgi:hypothetical protein